jgi:biopolymer transport protein ExbD
VRDKPIDGLNMVPFIDIMLVLLTIVLTTSSFIASGRVAVKLPQASPQPADTQPVRTVEIDAAGSLYLDGLALDLPQLRQRLAAVDRSTPLLLRADRGLALQRFIDVVDGLKQWGFARVAVQTQVARP